MKLPIELQYLEKLIRYRVQEEMHPSPVPAKAKKAAKSKATAAEKTATGEAGAKTTTAESEATSGKPKMPPYSKWELPLGQFVLDHELDADEACLLLIGLTHAVHADLFQGAIESELKKPGEFPHIGGVNGKNFRGMLPTGDTALFILAGVDWKKRLGVQQLFHADHFLSRKKILWLEEVPPGEPAMSGKIIVAQEYVELLTQGKASPPHFGISFPAKRITTELDWDHLVVNSGLTTQINDLLDWRAYHDRLQQKGAVEGRFRKGYRSLFHGPSGTGKTFTACLLGKAMKKDVYRIDLSMVVSKYIGETEKNLELLFTRAEDKDWILFFDEADAIFSKRTGIREAHDKYANQEVSYLLQRIEDYNGLVILASNMRNNIDEAFVRRFNSILHFPMPDVEERKLIWRKTFLPGTKFRLTLPGGGPGVAADAVGPGAGAGDDADIATVIEQVKHYQLSGGSILNVVHYASIKGVKRMPDRNKDGALTIYLPDIIMGIRLEFSKENIPFQ